MSVFKVQFLAASETIDLRMRILRPGQPREVCIYAEDDLPTTFHLGIVENAKILCNGTFMLQANEKFPQAKLPYRLRGMASDSDYQNKGLGRTIITAAETELKKRGCDLLWFNARVSAEGFYRKLGYEVIEDIFDIPGVGPHKIMYKYF